MAILNSPLIAGLIVVAVFIIICAVVRTLGTILRLAVCGIGFAYITYVAYTFLKISFDFFNPPIIMIPIIGFCIGWGIEEAVGKIPLPFIQALITIIIGLASATLYMYIEHQAMFMSIISKIA